MKQTVLVSPRYLPCRRLCLGTNTRPCSTTTTSSTARLFFAQGLDHYQYNQHTDRHVVQEYFPCQGYRIEEKQVGTVSPWMTSQPGQQPRQQRRWFSDSSSSSSSSSPAAPPTQEQQKPRRLKHPTDPMAKRPTHVCDPYGQGGQPMSTEEAQRNLATVDPHWRLQTHHSDSDSDSSSTDPPLPHPAGLVRSWWHQDYREGLQFLQTVAAVGQIHQQHYPHEVRLERVIRRKQWWTKSTVVCRTHVLDGLSTSDFYLAMMIDIELERPQVKQLIYVEEE